MSTGKRLEFGVLRPLELSIDGTPMPLGTPKQRAVLAMLLINRNRPVAADTLINAVWEHRPPPGVRVSLQSYISNLRRTLARAGVDDRTTLASAPPGYRLSVADGDCDIGRFTIEKAAGVQAAVAGQFEQASRHLSAALAEWRGPVLEDLREFQFVDAFATALVEDKVAALTARAEAEIACGRCNAVIGELESLADEHPYHEPLWVQLITAYYLSERQSDALDAFHRLKCALADDLGIDPGPTARALYERVLRQEQLDAKRAAMDSAIDTITAHDLRNAVAPGSAAAQLRDASGHVHPLRTGITRIGRLADNDIVLNDTTVSRHHAVIVDTGTSFTIADLRSSNGVLVGDKRIRGTTTLADGEKIRICDHEFKFEIQPGES